VAPYPDERFLNNILGIFTIPHETPCKTMSGSLVQHNQLTERHQITLPA